MQNLDLETLRERLVTKESQNLTAARGSLSKCAVLLREFTKATQSVARQPHDEDALSNLKYTANLLSRELKLQDLEMRKMALGIQAAESELSYYDSIGEKTQSSITKVREEIVKLKSDLQHEKKVRKNREEYEALAKMADGREPSLVTKRKLKVIQEEVNKIKEGSEHLQKKLRIKGKQFHLLSQCITDLKNSVQEDELRIQVEKSRQGT